MEKVTCNILLFCEYIFEIEQMRFADDGIFDENGTHATLLAAWRARGVTFSCVDFQDWVWGLPKNSGMNDIRKPFEDMLQGTVVASSLLRHLGQCLKPLNKERLGWIPRLLDLTATLNQHPPTGKPHT